MSIMEELLACDWGQQLLSDYHIVKCIHMSPLSEIFALESGDGRQRLILKGMRQALTSRALLETLKAIDYEGIVPVLDFHLTETYAYVVKPYVEGITLQDYMAMDLSMGSVLGIVRQLVQRVMVCHEQRPPIILRDLKPDNLMVHQGRLYLLDLESSKLKAVTATNRDTVLLGTPGYAAPEQYGFQTSDERTDIYAIGQVMLSLLMVSANQPRNKGVSRLSLLLENVIENPVRWSARRIAKRATAFDPQRRYASAGALKRSLDGIYPRLYMSFFAGLIAMVGLVLVGFRGPEVPTLAEVTEAMAKAQDATVTSPSLEPVTVSLGDSVEAPTEAPTEAQTEVQTEAPTEAKTETQKETQTSATQEKTTKVAKETKLEPPKATTRGEQKSTQGDPIEEPTTKNPVKSPVKTPVTNPVLEKTEVRFTGYLTYKGEATATKFLIRAWGISDPSYSNQFGSDVTFSAGQAEYTDLNKQPMVKGHQYKLTGYLDLNGNFLLDTHEPKQVVALYEFDGIPLQQLDFNQLASTSAQAEKLWMPGVQHIHYPSRGSFSTIAYRDSMDARLKDFDAFTVLGTNTSPNMAREFIVNYHADGQLKGLQYASPSRNKLEFSSVDSYVEDHMVIFLKGDVLIGYIHIVEGKALPYVVF